MTQQNPYLHPTPTPPMPGTADQATPWGTAPCDPVVFQRANLQAEQCRKSAVVTVLLWLFVGFVGGHRYYLGDTTKGILMTVTIGGIGIWALVDVLFIPGALRTANARIRHEVFTMNGIPEFSGVAPAAQW